ncbi:uncharacterized protein [Hoplias malabaricus]|uniref:uncharacterized protein n=1 Tax=Hoplias malabaricus TaxID=27720 RepID=UPI003461D0D6
MIYLSVGLAFILLNAGKSGLCHIGGLAAALEKPQITVSLREVTLGDIVTLTCATKSNADVQCSFFSSLLRNSTFYTISQNKLCEISVSGDLLLKAEDVHPEWVRTELRVYCTVANGSKYIHSPSETIAVWRISAPMIYAVFGLAVGGFLIVFTLVSLSVICISFVCSIGDRRAFERCNSKTGSTDEYTLDPFSEEDEEEKETKETEDELCYATVIHSENSARCIKFGQRTEYAMVVVNMVDNSKPQPGQYTDSVDEAKTGNADEPNDAL